MGNSIDATGLTTYTQAELVAKFQAEMQAIYGADINLEQDSPDGQMMMIFIQIVLDNLDLITQVYNSFDPERAIGINLDHRVAYNGIQRQAGTYTVTPVTITVTKALTLYGLDQDAEDVYTVSDDAGNTWQLIETQSPSSAGSYSYNFQSVLSGARTTLLNTITVPVSIVLGVSAINNPTSYLTLGIDEESDSDLRLRRAKAVTISSKGYLAGLVSALENITGMDSAKVFENTTDSTDADGIPAKSIWVIVSGTASDEEIGLAIYNKRNAGCGMKGSQSYTITQLDGTEFTVYWDEVTTEDVYIYATLEPLDGITVIDRDGLEAVFPDNFNPGLYEQININDVATVIQSLDSNVLATEVGLSYTDGGTLYNKLTPANKSNKFLITTANLRFNRKLTITPSEDFTMGHDRDFQFTAEGGDGTLVWSVVGDGYSSTATITQTGLYHSNDGTGVDIVTVTDGDGDSVSVNVTVEII